MQIFSLTFSQPSYKRGLVVPVVAGALIEPQRAFLFRAGEKHHLAAVLSYRDLFCIVKAGRGKPAFSVFFVGRCVFDEGVWLPAVGEVDYHDAYAGRNYPSVHICNYDMVIPLISSRSPVRTEAVSGTAQVALQAYRRSVRASPVPRIWRSWMRAPQVRVPVPHCSLRKLPQ